jgi:hypothetical protein
MSAQQQIQRLEAIVQKQRAEVAQLTQENGQLRRDKMRLNEENSQNIMLLQVAIDELSCLNEQNGRLLMGMDQLAASQSSWLKERNGRLRMDLDDRHLSKQNKMGWWVVPSLVLCLVWLFLSFLA